MPTSTPSPTDARIQQVVEQLRARLASEAHVNVVDVTITGASPVNDASLAASAEVLISARAQALDLSPTELEPKRGQVLDGLRRVVAPTDWLVDLVWRVWAASVKAESRGTIHDEPTREDAQRIVTVRSTLVFDPVKGEARFDSFAAGLRVGAVYQRTADAEPAETPTGPVTAAPARATTAAAPAAAPAAPRPASVEPAATTTESLGEYTYELSDVWGPYVSWRWRASLVKTAGRVWASPDEGRSDTFRFKLVFYPEIVSHAWYYWPDCAARFCVIGSGGSLPPSPPYPFATTEGDPFTAYLTLESAAGREDYVSDVTTDLYTAPGTGGITLTLTVEYHLGMSLTFTPPDEPRWLMVNDVASTREQIAIEHRTQYSSPGAMKGGCNYGGHIEISGRVRTAGESDSELGRITLQSSIWACYMDFYAAIYTWRARYWRHLSTTLEYVRGQAVKRPELSCSLTRTRLTVGETTQLTATVRNPSAVVSVTDAWVTLDRASLEDVLDIYGGQGARVRVASPSNPLAPGGSVQVPYTLQAGEAGDATPELKLDYTLGSPVPQDSNSDWTFATAAEVVTTAGVPATGSLAGTITSRGRPVEGALVRVQPGNRRTWSGADGTYSLGALPAASYTVQVSCFGYQEATAQATVTAGTSVHLDAQLTALPSVQYIGNLRSHELHTPGCRYVARMRPHNQVAFSSLPAALGAGYDGCHYCLDEYDRA